VFFYRELEVASYLLQLTLQTPKKLFYSLQIVDKLSVKRAGVHGWQHSDQREHLIGQQVCTQFGFDV
jgi:hypothetical protein